MEINRRAQNLTDFKASVISVNEKPWDIIEKWYILKQLARVSAERTSSSKPSHVRTSASTFHWLTSFISCKVMGISSVNIYFDFQFNSSAREAPFEMHESHWRGCMYPVNPLDGNINQEAGQTAPVCEPKQGVDDTSVQFNTVNQSQIIQKESLKTKLDSSALH